LKRNATLTLESPQGTSLRFGVRADDRVSFHLDSGPHVADPSPTQVLLASVAACTGMDVIAILRKKRQQVTGYDIDIVGDRADEHPRRFTKMAIVHRFHGVNLSIPAIEEAIRLSEEKYCSVSATLRGSVEIVSRYEVVAG
jgi:putative redox protein